MANTNTVTVQLTVKDDGSVVMKQFGQTTEEAMGKASASAKNTAGSMSSLSGSFLDLAAKATAAYMVIVKSMEYMDKGVKADQAEATFRSLAETSSESADAIIANMKRATAGTIDDSQMMQKAAKAMMLEFSGDQITKMAEMARVAARTSGEDVGVVFDNIVNSISTKMPRTLKQMGLVTAEQISMIDKAMAEGVDGVDLYSLALSNLNVQQAKMGDMAENSAEKLQQNKVTIEETKESAGRLFAAIKESALSFDNEPMVAYFEKMMGLQREDYDETIAIANQKKAAAVAESEANRKRMNDEIKASQALTAQKKADLETMKALDAAYFKSQEENLKAYTEIQKAVGADEFLIAQETIKKREELNTEFYNRTKLEIENEAAARSKADRDKISDAAYVAQKIQALDAETTNKSKTLMQERTQAAITAANNDIKNLQSRLNDYQTYYDSLEAKMDKNIEDEKQHLEAIKTLRQQQVNYEKTAADMQTMMQGTDEKLTAQQKYESGRSSLNQQYLSNMNLSAADQIPAMEAYIKAVGQFQQQYKNGVTGANDIFGNPDIIISAAKVFEDSSSDINRALGNQRSATAALVEEQKKAAEADQQWGQTLQEEAQKAQTSMENLKTKIGEISDQIINMQTSITLTADDQMSSVISGIISQIEKLHALAAQPISIGSGSYASSSSSYAESSYDFSAGSGTPVIDSYADGTPYVPRTGTYQLHQGEAVIPAAENNGGNRSIIINGGINIQIPEAHAPKNPEDWRMITRNYIVPELNKINR